ncbi:MAG: hypothetical protein ACLFVB_01615 [Thermoplasmata archaeon]
MSQFLRLSIVFIINIGIALGMTYYVKNYITGPLVELSDSSKKVAEGDFSEEINNGKIGRW